MMNKVGRNQNTKIIIFKIRLGKTKIIDPLKKTFQVKNHRKRETLSINSYYRTFNTVLFTGEEINQINQLTVKSLTKRLLPTYVYINFLQIHLFKNIMKVCNIFRESTGIK